MHPCFAFSADVSPHTPLLLTIIRTLNSIKIYPFADWIHTVNGYLFLVVEKIKCYNTSDPNFILWRPCINRLLEISSLPKQSIPSLSWNARNYPRCKTCIIIHVKDNTQMVKLSLRGIVIEDIIGEMSTHNFLSINRIRIN